MRAFLLSLASVLLVGYALSQGIPPNEARTLGTKVPNIRLVDAEGREFDLYELKGKPVLLSPIYARCPTACVQIGNSLSQVIPKVGTPGVDFWVLSLTFDPKETRDHIRHYQLRHRIDGKGWRVVYAKDPKALFALLDAIDFRFTYLSEEIKDHPNFLVALSDQMEIRHYVYGTTFTEAQIRKALRYARGELTWWERAVEGWLAPTLVLMALGLAGWSGVLWRRQRAVPSAQAEADGKQFGERGALNEVVGRR